MLKFSYRNKKEPVVDGLKEKDIQTVDSLVNRDLKEVNNFIIANIKSEVPLIPVLSEYLLKSGGKRIRPRLTILFSKLFGYNYGKRHIQLSACIECIHMASLLHDDVVDESAVRRGRKTANRIWGNKASVLVGDYLFSKAFQIMVKDNDSKVLDALSETTRSLAQGEVLQLSLINNLDISEEKYFKVIEDKTAKLFAASAMVGGIVAKADTKTLQKISEYGKYIGIAYQLLDDALDYESSSKRIGKKVGDDFKEGKATMPILLAFSKSNSEEKEFWIKAIEKLKQNKKDFAIAQKIIKKYDCLSLTRALAEKYCQKAKLIMKDLPENTYNNQLIKLTSFVSERSN